MIWTDDSDFYKKSFSHELTWNSDVPYSSILNNSQTGNTCDRYGHSLTDLRETSGTDNRHVHEILPVHFNCLKDDAEWAKIDIDYPTVNENGEFTPIRGFFVTLDNHFAIESSNSEINAWTTYIYKNVAKYPYNHGIKDTSLSELEEPITLQQGNKGTIYIKNDRNVLWDVIGFRVHAVNLDGTLTDPDGRAFYVKVYNAVIDGIYYTFNLINKTAAVTSGNIDYSGSVTIPPSVTYCGVDFSVTGIGNDAFEGCDNLTSVTIPSSVTSIGNYAFRNCRDLSSVTIPTSVTSIGKFAFDGTTWYNNQPVGLVYADKVLYKYKGTMPENESIVIKDGTLVIADCAFSGCSNLTSVEIPNTVTNIGNSAFQGCTGLTSLTIPNSVTSIGYAVFSGCSGLTSVIIPNSVTSIGNSAFSRCTGLTSVTIPNSVTSIRNSAFSDCFSLTDVYCYAADVPSAENNAFNNTNANATLHVPASALSAYRSTSPWNNSFNTIDVVGNVPAPKTFDASGLRHTVIPGTSTVSVSATSTALSGCVSIPEVAINEGTPYSVVAIDKVAFYDCTDLTSLTIAKSVKTIGYGAFKGCEALTRLIAIGDEPIVMTNGQDVFAGINFDLCELHVPVDSKSEYEEAEGWRLFSTIVEDIINVDSIISDDGMTCNFNYSITNNNEISLLGVNGDVTVTAGAFTIPSGVTKDGKEYVVTSIAPNAFENCTDMTSLTIPESITSIGDHAFAGCTGLKEIFCFSSVPIDLSTMLARGLMRTASGTVPTQLEGIDFENCILYVPFGTSRLYREAEGWCLFRNIHEQPDGELSLGDVNCDSEVNNLDVNLIGSHIAGEFPSSFVWDAADMNHDGEVDIVDVTALIQMLLDKKP